MNQFIVSLETSKNSSIMQKSNRFLLKQGGDIAGPILQKSPKKTYAISRFLAKILPVALSPKMPNIAEFFGDLYYKLLCGRHE
jgi:hypothetical protein